MGTGRTAGRVAPAGGAVPRWRRWVARVGLLVAGGMLPSPAAASITQVAVLGGSFSFLVTADGTRPFSYQWRKNGVAIPGATQERFGVTQVAAADAGAYSVVVSNALGTATSEDGILIVNAVNTAPTISALANRTLAMNGSTGAIAFTVGDLETAAGSLAVSRSSSNQTLVPDAAIVLGGAGASRTVTVTPVAGRSGTATISLTVSDGTSTATSTFGLTVTASNTAPTISDLASRTINEDASTGAMTFTVGDAQTAAGSLTLSGSSSNPTLVPVAAVVFGGSGSARTVTVTPVANRSGTATISVTVSDGMLTATDTFVLTVNPVNDAPTISNVANRTVAMNGSTGAVGFTVGDLETAAGSLVLSRNSSNQTLVPNSAIVLGGSGANRTVTVTPAANRSGTATISLVVSDGALTATDTFVLTVSAPNTAPTLSDIASRTINEDGTTGSIGFTVGDAETAAGNLTVSGTSSNQGLVPNASIVFGGSGASRTVTVAAAPNRSGTATISVTVSDGTLSATDSFLLTVVSVNDRPTISSLANRTIAEDGSTGLISFSVNDAETAAASLTLAVTSSNPTLVPPGAVVFGGAETNRTLTVTPAANQNGTATLSVTVSDGSLTATSTFVLTVSAVNDAPTISAIANWLISEDGATGPVDFTVGDAETAPASLVVTATSSNQALVPNPALVLEGSGANRTLSVSPLANQSGSATITVTVSDGALTASRTFGLTVNAVNDAPTISGIGAQAVAPNGTTGAVPFAIGDVETAAAALIVTGTSSNQTLVPDAAIVLGGGGANRTVTVTPAANRSGTARIDLRVSDGVVTTVSSFVLTVGAAPDQGLVVMSTLGVVESNQPLAGGFVLSGTGTKRMLLRGVGPSLNVVGNAAHLAQPRLRLFSASGQLLLETGAWSGSTELLQAFARLGASPFAAGSADAAALLDLGPGAYTVQVTDGGQGIDMATGRGLALAEVFDASEGPVSGGARLGAGSLRGRVVPSGNILTGGLVVGGSAPSRFLIRGLGPALAQGGALEVASNPMIALFSSQQELLASNNDWESPVTVNQGYPAVDAAAIRAATTALGLPLFPTGSLDSAVIVTLAPGVYSLTGMASAGVAGVASVEVHEIP